MGLSVLAISRANHRHIDGLCVPPKGAGVAGDEERHDSHIRRFCFGNAMTLRQNTAYIIIDVVSLTSVHTALHIVNEKQVREMCS